MAELNKYIIGQDDAKRAVAVALRNRYRRQLLLRGNLRREVQPKNILMIGPTGVGKTEVARRVAKIVDAPFIKVEATKFTEVGYVGRDVESIVRDLVEVAISNLHSQRLEQVKDEAAHLAAQRLAELDCRANSIMKRAARRTRRGTTPKKKRGIDAMSWPAAGRHASGNGSLRLRADTRSKTRRSRSRSKANGFGG